MAVVAAANGQSSIVGSATGEYTFADRYGYVAVTNTGTDAIYVTADGSTPEAAGAAGTAITIAGNETRIIANGMPLWYQSSRVINSGSNANALGAVTTSNPSTPTAPGFVTPMESLAGYAGQSLADDGNPGTVINVAGTTPTFSLEGTG